MKRVSLLLLLLVAGPLVRVGAQQLGQPSAPLSLAPPRPALLTPDLAAARAALLVADDWGLPAGPLTIEVLDGFGRLLARTALASARPDADSLRLPMLAPGTYTVRILDAHRLEVSRWRMVITR